MKSTTEKLSSSKGISINDTLTEIIDSAGGLTNTQSAGALPKSSQQVSYFKSKVSKLMRGTLSRITAYLL